MFRSWILLTLAVVHVSAFVPLGRSSLDRATTLSSSTLLLASVAKRGKAVKPPRSRHDYNHGRTARELRNEGVEPRDAQEGAGNPVFNLYVRAHRRQVRSILVVA